MDDHLLTVEQPGGFFNSPTYGRMSFSQMIGQVMGYVNESPNLLYRIVVGSDSQPKNSCRFDFVSAVVVHRVGNGGIYFWQRRVRERRYVLRERIYEEALMSLMLARHLVVALPEEDLYSLEIHVDIGKRGETRDMITEVVGMIRGQGFEVKTKPAAYGAACVADRYA